MKKIIILAGNRKEFEDYLSKNGLTYSEAIYGYEVRILYGIQASSVKVIGTFWERNDAIKLRDFAESRVF